MDTQNTNTQIEQSQWKQYLTDFTSRNANRPARLEILGDEIGASEEANHLPFMMASYEEKGSNKGDALITLGGAMPADGSQQVMHTLKGVTSITPQIGGARESALEIAGADEKAILIFDQPLELETQTSGS